MTALYDYLLQSAALDAEGGWNWGCNPTVSWLGSDDIKAWLKRNPERKACKILPVSGWYDSDPMRKIVKRMGGTGNQEEYATSCVAEYGLTANNSIKKLVFTDAMTGYSRKMNQPSWFISPQSGEGAIKKGDEFILVDDVIESGGTLRDLIKHINLRGGVVRAVVNTSLDTLGIDTEFYSEGIRKRNSEKLIALLYAADKGMTDKIGKIYSTYSGDCFESLGLPEEQKAQIIKTTKDKANQLLSVVGLTWDQLTINELDSGCMDIKYHATPGFSSDRFWHERLSNLTPALPPPVAKVERLQELSDLLGTEFQEKWTAANRFDANTATGKAH